MDGTETIEPFDVGQLDVGDGHNLYYEQIGCDSGMPIVYLHGGPGAGCSLGARHYFNPKLHRAVLFDQRSSGRSTPHASEEHIDWTSIDMDHHVSDIERLREHLGIRKWAVFGISWGSVLGATYAERHPERVTALVLAAVSTGTADDVDWFAVHAGRIFPAAWNEFVGHIPSTMRNSHVIHAYNDLLMDADPTVRNHAAEAWCK